MKRLTLLLTVLSLIAGYPVFGQNGSSTCLHQWAPQNKVFQRGYQKQMVRGFQCQFCARFLTSIPSQRSRYWIASTTSWVSDPRDRNNVMIEREIRRTLRKPTGELTKADLEKVAKLYLFWKRLTDVKGLEKLNQLKELSLWGNQLTDVTGLENLTKLTVLGLGVNRLTDVKGLEKLNQLEWLSLNGNQLTDVKGLEKLTRLTYLNLYNNPDLTKAQIDQLKKALPKCMFYSNPKK